MKVYLDYAASTPLHPSVFEAMKPYFLEFSGNPSSTHEFGRNLRNAIEEARRRIAKCMHCRPLELFFTGGGTEADNMAIRGAVSAYGIQHIISSPIEHHAVTHPIELLEKEGKVGVTWLQVNEKGLIDLNDLKQALEQHPKSLVSIMHANNEIGTINDIRAIGDLCREYEALFHSDTVQTIGKIPIRLEELPVDFISASSHKFQGPKGVGFLYIRKGLTITPLATGGGQERDLRPGTENVPAIAGMAFALQKACDHMEEHNQHLHEIKSYMKAQLENRFSGLRYNGAEDQETCLPSILNVTLPGEGDPMILFNLDLKGIATSAGSACSSGAVMGSHVLHHIGVQPEDMPRSIRFSFGPQTTKEEIDYTIEALEELLIEKA